jgi:hypothetical protein
MRARAVRALAASIAIHALIVCWFAYRAGAPDSGPDTARPDTSRMVAELSEPAPITVDLVGTSTGGGGGGGSRESPASGARGHVMSRNGSRSGVSESEASSDAWAGLSIHDEPRAGDGNGNGSGNGDSNGNGNGNGNGFGIGFGNGGGIHVARDVPAPPPPPKVSRARPPQLIWPNRDLDVIDESYLFAAKVTVDRDGSVVGARMVTTRPGSRGDRAADVIWSFRYAPALDDDGNPVRATIEQSFQVR